MTTRSFHRTIMLFAIGLMAIWLPTSANASPQDALPAADRPWFGDDYLTFARAMDANAVALPVLSDKGGRGVV